MNLTQAQLDTLAANIAADPTLGALPHTGDNAYVVADAYNLNASPDFWVWRRNVTITETGNAFNGTELAGLTTGNQSRLQTIALYSASGYDPTLADRRAFFNDVFSGAGGNITRPQLDALWKRKATRAEKLYANTSGGNGANATPAALGPEGALSPQNVKDAWKI